MDENKIINEANIYLSSDNTLGEVAIELGISRRTLQLHIKKLESIDNNLYKLVRDKQNKNQIDGRVKGGTNGKRGVSYTKEQANYLAEEIINKQLTYEEAQKLYGIASSTIYDMVHSEFINVESRKKLDAIATANTHKITLEQYQEETCTRNRMF